MDTAEEEAMNDMNDIGTVTCRDILMASGKDRDGAVLVLHGYVLGEKKQLKYDTEVLSVATDAFLNNCIENPDK